MREEPCPRFRQDLIVRRVVEAGEVGFTIRDPLSGGYYRQHPMTRALCTLLDGVRTPSQVLREMGQRYPQYRFSRDFLDEAFESLRRLDFLEDTFRRNLMLIERGRVERRGLLQPESLKNVLNIQLGVIDPLPLFRRIHPYVRVVFTRPFVLAVMALFVFAAALLWGHRDVLTRDVAVMFTLNHATPLNLLLLYVTLFFTIVAHEFGHGLCCYHYGGEPRRIGLLLMYCMPGMFCDVSDTYFFEKRWPRAATALAGTYVEIMVFALATFLWVLTPDDLLIHDISYRTMLFAGVSGLLFNMNPLIKLDGYYVLMSWLDVRLLRERSFEWMGARVRSLFTRDKSKIPRATRRERRIFAIYASFAMVYSVVILWFALRFVHRIFVGGLREVGVAIFLVFFVSMTKRYWLKGWKRLRLVLVERTAFAPRRAALHMGGVAAAAVLLLAPLPHFPRHEAELEAVAIAPVRAPVAGTVTEVFVSEGDAVRPGTVLARISGREVEAARRVEEAGWQEAGLTERERQREQSTTLAARLESASARRRAADRADVVAWLSSPDSGRVLTARPGSLYGRAVAPGDSVLAVGRLDSLLVSIPLVEREAEDVAIGRRAELRLRVEPGRVHRFVLDHVDLAPDGAGFESATAHSLSANTRPRVYRAYGKIANPDGRLRPGLSGIVRIQAPPQSLLGRLARLYARMVRADFWL